ncbi:lactonase family protein [Mucilaginibacter sp. RS28]|uniref:Lactonase family protein n=1 Tax=Mucilaginibacter straminoryzae TaxID=2932774 RepID=A0A9X2BAH5_9SPHI|nr:lactonase family protein [Mucilaginibacter straminoryzae]MCJ8211396.1 lactonase family protein [Mucilaginibacter straminoryzae]
MKKLLLVVILSAPSLLFAQKKLPKTYDLLIGTYTKPGGSTGIQVYRFYAETGRMAYLSQTEINNPSYLCVSSNNKFVYAVNEDDANSGISAFSFEPSTGLLKPINRQSSIGKGPCYVSVDKDQKHVFAANYKSGSLNVFPINKDGSLGAVVQNIQDTGSGPDTSRQKMPHVHTAVLSPDDKYLLYTDLGTDKLNIAKYSSSADQPLKLLAENGASVKGGDGPRHLDFSPDHKFVYLLTEMAGTIYAYEYKGGKMKQVQTISILPENFHGNVGAADIHLSADGNFLYASNRGTANEIVYFSVNKETGQLTYLDRISTFGQGPRNFTIDPTGNFLLVGNQNSDNIVVYKRNQQTGKLTATNIRLNVGSPVCLKFAPAE